RSGVFRAAANICIGGEVKHEIVAYHRLLQPVEIEKVPLEQSEILLRSGTLQKMPPARGKIVVHGDGMAVGQQPVRQVAADEASSAGDKSTHPATSESTWAFQPAFLLPLTSSG